MSLYQTVQLIHDWHMMKLSAYEKRFIKSMREGLDGLGNDPTDREVIDGCGLYQKQVALIRKIGKRFLIN